MRLFSNIISGMFHPLLITTYGIILLVSFTYLAILPTVTKLFIVGGTFLSTAAIPGAALFLMVRRGVVSDMELTKRDERMIPYLIMTLALQICIFYLGQMTVPFWFTSLLFGASAALGLAMLINFYWKISAHAIGMGCLLAGMMGIARIHFINPYWGFILTILAAGLVGTSRIFLKRHTPMQVYAGFCLGFICTFTASYLSYIHIIHLIKH